MKRASSDGSAYRYFLFVVFFVFILLIYASPVFAVSITITNAPSSVNQSEEFIVTFSASDLETNTQYYEKVRIGTGGTYTKGETKNGDNWLGDTDSWSNFPTVTTDSSGSISTSLTARAKDTAEIGTNQLYVRLRKVGASSNISPDGETSVTVNQAPSPTPTLTPTSIPAPTSTPVNTPTPTRTPTPTNTPTPTRTPTPTPPPANTSAPTAAPATVLTSTKKPTPTNKASRSPTSILGINVASNKEDSKEEPTPTPRPKGNAFSIQTVVSGIVFLAGLGLAASCGILVYRSYKNRIGSQREV